MGPCGPCGPMGPCGPCGPVAPISPVGLPIHSPELLITLVDPTRTPVDATKLAAATLPVTEAAAR